MAYDKINSKTKEIVESFLATHIYPNILDFDNLLGVVIHGSSVTGYTNKNSDIDLLILLNRADQPTRGVCDYMGQKIEYFIKPIEYFLTEAVKFTKSNCPSHVALNENGYILYDRGDIIKNFLNADNQFYNANRQQPNVT